MTRYVHQCHVRVRSVVVVFAMMMILTGTAGTVLAAEKDGRGPGLKATPEAGPLQPRLGGKATAKPLTRS